MATAVIHPFAPYLTVAASAGTGKTHLLIQRILHLLLVGHDPAGILAITFTRKAAAEMQTRLQQQLRALALADSTTLDTTLEGLGIEPTSVKRQLARGLFETLLHSTGRVNTSTFHSFCQNLLRRFPLEADVPPGFELIERLGPLYDQAWQALTLQMTTQPDTPIAQAMDVLLHTLGYPATHDYLNEFLHKRSDWWALAAEHANPVEITAQRLQQQLQVSPGQNLVADFLGDSTQRRYLNEFAQLLHTHRTATNQQHAEIIAHGLAELEPSAATLEKLLPVFFTQKLQPLKRKSSTAQQQSLGVDGERRFLELHNHFCESCVNLLRDQHAQQTYSLSHAWMVCGEQYLRHFQRIKRELRVLDFSDLEWKTYQLLCRSDNAHWVQYKLDARIEHILVDEFQDTNPTQWQLLLPLLEEISASDNTGRERSVLLVGDSKQSIYRFRRAEPRLFDTASAWLQQRLNARHSQLTTSWRSSPAIISFVNRLFSTAPLHEQLSNFIPHQTVHTDLWGRVILLPLVQKPPEVKLAPASGRNLLTTPRHTPRPSVYYREGQQLATAIQTLIANATPVVVGKQTRAASYSDIMILCRRRTHIGDYERALREAGIPYIGNERGTLLDSLEIKDLVNLLQWLITPFDNLALAGILRSPLFAASDEDLLHLCGKGDWFARLQQLSDLVDNSPLQRAAKLLPQWLALTRIYPVHDLLDKIYSEANVLARFTQAAPPHLRARVQANLSRFLELALEVDSGRYPSLTRFIQWLQIVQQQPDEAPDQPASTLHHERVQLLTIHAAKGLEAPIIFIADTTHELDEKNTTQVIVDWPFNEQRPQILFLHPNSPYPNHYSAKLLDRNQGLELRETVNLLYVAVTRARQYLYFSGVAGKALNSDSIPGWYGAVCQCYHLGDSIMQTEVCVEHHATAPLLTPRTATPSSDPPVALDPRLREVFKPTQRRREIAPSNSVVYNTSLDSDAPGQLRGLLIHAMLQQRLEQVDLPIKHFRLPIPHSVAEGLLHACWNEVSRVMLEPTLQFIFDPRQYQSAYNEAPVMYYSDDVLVHGVVDRIVISAEAIYVIDYKTQRLLNPDAMLQLAAHYMPQLAYYTQAARHLWPHHPILPGIVFTACPTWWPVNLPALA